MHNKPRLATSNYHFASPADNYSDTASSPIPAQFLPKITYDVEQRRAELLKKQIYKGMLDDQITSQHRSPTRGTETQVSQRLSPYRHRTEVNTIEAQTMPFSPFTPPPSYVQLKREDEQNRQRERGHMKNIQDNIARQLQSVKIYEVGQDMEDEKVGFSRYYSHHNKTKVYTEPIYHGYLKRNDSDKINACLEDCEEILSRINDDIPKTNYQTYQQKRTLQNSRRKRIRSDPYDSNSNNSNGQLIGYSFRRPEPPPLYRRRGKPSESVQLPPIPKSFENKQEKPIILNNFNTAVQNQNSSRSPRQDKAINKKLEQKKAKNVSSIKTVEDVIEYNRQIHPEQNQFLGVRAQQPFSEMVKPMKAKDKFDLKIPANKLNPNKKFPNYSEEQEKKSLRSKSRLNASQEDSPDKNSLRKSKQYSEEQQKFMTPRRESNAAKSETQSKLSSSINSNLVLPGSSASKIEQKSFSPQSTITQQPALKGTDIVSYLVRAKARGAKLIQRIKDHKMNKYMEKKENLEA